MNQFTGRKSLRVCAASRMFSIALLALFVLLPQVARAQALPPPWATTNVGAPALSGRASHSSGTFTVEGAGKRIGYASDQFFFVQQQISGDATIVARVQSIENTNSSAKAGVMIRESLAANARHAFALVTPLAGIGFHRRRETGGSTSGTNLPGVAPVWLKLVRYGSTLTASYSSNGTTWTTIGTDTIPMANRVYVGLAVSSYNTSVLATGTFANVSVSGPVSTSEPEAAPPASSLLPSGWANADVGNPVLTGVSGFANGGFSITGSGTDIWSISDQFQFAYRKVSGDVDVIARVASQQAPSGWSKAGVMVRATLAADAPHTSMFVTPSNGLAFQRRPATGMWSLHTSAGAGVAPVWVKLERRGSAITGFRSNDGVSWTMIGSQTLTLPATFYVGLAVTSNNTGARATAQFTNVNVVSGSTSTNVPPTVSLTAPATGSTYTAPATVNMVANAADVDNGIAQVEFYAKGSLIGTDTTAPYGYTWSGVAAGSYTITAVARDKAGATATSSASSITVKTASGGTNVPPAVSLTAPAAGATYTAPASVTISASATDSDGTVARVDFYAGATLVGSDTTNPYSVTWINAPAGSFALTAVARDNLGAVTTSVARGIVISNPTLPGHAVFTPSADHAIVSRYVLEIFTAGANPSTATAVARKDLGKPPVVNGQCFVDISATTMALPGGNYFATVVAVSSGGTSPRAVSPIFAR